MYSEFLSSKHDVCKALIERLKARYPYVSLLGKHVTGTFVEVTSNGTDIEDTFEKQCGFVVKLYNGYTYAEYSFTDITEEGLDDLEKDIIEKTAFPKELIENHVPLAPMKDEPLVQSFSRPVEGRVMETPEIIERLTAFKDKMQGYDPRIVQAMAAFSLYETSALFLSPNRDLNQNYTWMNVYLNVVAAGEDGVRFNYDGAAYNSYEQSFEVAEKKIQSTCQTAIDLLSAEKIVPGVYDIITEPSITGLIAHEAFGHGVEMDMFVKNRAKSRLYLNKPVASPLVEMHDGAGATLSCASYFFDDDGVLAHDTLIIKDGILQTGISDAVSALQLGTEPTGNGRRESAKRKAYTRMTNTFFSPGKDKVEDMIASVKHGYILSQTDNGMEDPKNWNIQCVAAYGREIVDGKLTGKIVAPVVMSGYVPDLLMSISMVSDTFEVIGSGHCGKGYKEWVVVSDGGPYLKARCKLG